jgi:hypothetical protein
LHFAAESGHCAACDALILSGAFVDCEDIHGRTPLMSAAQYDQGAVCRLLLDYGADVEVRDTMHGYTVLHIAVRALGDGTFRALQVLCESGLCPLDSRDVDGQSADELLLKLMESRSLKKSDAAVAQAFLAAAHDREKKKTQETEFTLKETDRLAKDVPLAEQARGMENETALSELEKAKWSESDQKLWEKLREDLEFHQKMIETIKKEQSRILHRNRS